MQADPLAQLRDIRLPEPIGWWPIAPGWWFLIFLTLFIIAAFAFKRLQKKRENRYRLVARDELQVFNTRYKEDQNAKVFLSDTQKLLRRVALHRYPQQRRKFASLSGHQWLKFLNDCCVEKVFKETDMPLFESLPYKNDVSFDTKAWQTSVASWLEQHR